MRTVGRCHRSVHEIRLDGSEYGCDEIGERNCAESFCTDSHGAWGARGRASEDRMEVRVQRDHDATVEPRALEDLLIGRPRQADVGGVHDIVTAPYQLHDRAARKALIEQELHVTR